jgi:hypothetical protein
MGGMLVLLPLEHREQPILAVVLVVGMILEEGKMAALAS